MHVFGDNFRHLILHLKHLNTFCIYLLMCRHDLPQHLSLLPRLKGGRCHRRRILTQITHISHIDGYYTKQIGRPPNTKSILDMKSLGCEFQKFCSISVNTAQYQYVYSNIINLCQICQTLNLRFVLDQRSCQLESRCRAVGRRQLIAFR